MRAAPQERGPSLHVGGLPDKGFYDLDLQQFFTQAGFKVVHATVASDPKSVNRKSLGYGYVSFAEESEMLRCLSEMNNKPCRDHTISLSKQVDQKNLDPKANVFVRNLDRALTQSQLHAHMAQFGSILSLRLQTDSHGHSQGFGFVQFSRAEEAARAIDACDGKNFAGKPMQAMIHKKRSERAHAAAPAVTNLFVKNLPKGTTDDQLAAMFAPFGDILTAKVQIDNATQHPLDYGYVNFKRAEDAEKAIADMNLKKVGNGVLIVNAHIPKSHNQNQVGVSSAGQLDAVALNIKRGMGSNVFINFIPQGVTEEECRREFEKAGSIVSLKLTQHPAKSFQHAYVLYSDVQEAQKAIRTMHDSTVFGSRRPIYVDFWMSKQEMDAERKQKSEHDLNRMLKNLFTQP